MSGLIFDDSDIVHSWDVEAVLDGLRVVVLVLIMPNLIPDKVIVKLYIGISM